MDAPERTRQEKHSTDTSEYLSGAIELEEYAQRQEQYATSAAAMRRALDRSADWVNRIASEQQGDDEVSGSSTGSRPDDSAGR